MIERQAGGRRSRIGDELGGTHETGYAGWWNKAAAEPSRAENPNVRTRDSSCPAEDAVVEEEAVTPRGSNPEDAVEPQRHADGGREGRPDTWDLEGPETQSLCAICQSFTPE